jgi:septum formation protein
MSGPVPQLILASSSPYRQQLLQRIGVPFTVVAPEIDESPRPAEEPAELVRRLASEKAMAVAATHPDQVVIGSDQLASLEGRVLGKPGSAEKAVEQLAACSGHSVEFLTGVCLLDGRRPGAEATLHMDITRVVFRGLRRDEIERYVAREMPIDCAGEFHSEGLGIALFERIDSQDPTGLVGLPLIWLSKALIHLGFEVL